MKERARTAAPFLPALLLMAAIFAASSMTSHEPDRPFLEVLLRKGVHFSEYAVLAALWWWALARHLDGRALAPACAIALAYSASDEFHQTFVTGRTGTPRDVLIDAAGIATAAFLITRRRDRREQDRAVHA